MKKNNLFAAGVLAFALVLTMAVSACKNAPDGDKLPTVTAIEVGALDPDLRWIDKASISTSDVPAFNVTIKAGGNPVNKLYFTIRSNNNYIISLTPEWEPPIEKDKSGEHQFYIQYADGSNFTFGTAGTYTMECFAEDKESFKSTTKKEDIRVVP